MTRLPSHRSDTKEDLLAGVEEIGQEVAAGRRKVVKKKTIKKIVKRKNPDGTDAPVEVTTTTTTHTVDKPAGEVTQVENLQNVGGD